MAMLPVAIGQIRSKKGDYAENVRRVGATVGQVAGWDEHPDLVVFPEAMTSGYFVEGGVRDVAVTAGTLFRDLSDMYSGFEGPPIDVVVGFYEEFRHHYFNSAIYASLGGVSPEIKHVHRKMFLPTYGVFDESRFVDPGHAVRAFNTSWGRAAIIICEDAWHSVIPAIAALDGAQLIIIPSASPARGTVPEQEGGHHRPASADRWYLIMKSIAEEHSVFVLSSQLVGFEGGKGFPGGSAVVSPSGDLIAEAPFFEETVLSTVIDLDEITSVRADQSLLSDLETRLPHIVENLQDRSPHRLEFDPESVKAPTTERASGASHAITPGLEHADPLAIDPELLTKWLTAFLSDEVSRRGFPKGIVALSGGVDSSLTAYLAVRAFGKENVIGLRLPYRTSSPQSMEHAALVAEHLGIELPTVDITKSVDGYLAALGSDVDSTRKGNVMARMRMIALFDLSVAHGALPLGTGNKTERLMGYFTWHADDTPPVNPLGDLFKTQVWELARYVGVPDAIVSKPATADLVAGQTDEGDLGVSYQIADRILHWLVRGIPPQEVAELGFDQNDVELVHRRLESTHWKRRLPTVAMVSQTAIGEYYLRPVDY